MNIDLLDEIKKVKMKGLEAEMKNIILSEGAGYIFICPYCNYTSEKNSKGSAKIFDDNRNKFFKCFACGIWRKVK